MHILLITDLYQGSDHSAVEAIFARQLATRHMVHRVYFDRSATRATREDRLIILPHACRRHGLAHALASVVKLSDYDWIIVRNLFPALASILRGRGGEKPKIAFWDSFPHAYRRYYESQITGRARWRKGLEYRWRARSESHLLTRCDAYLPITETHQRLFHPALAIPTHPLPLGFDFANQSPSDRPSRSGPLRFIYAGTIDRLRQMETVLAGFARAKGDYELHLYSPTQGNERDEMDLPRDPRFFYHSPVSRGDLMHRLAQADIGVGLIPPERLYLGSSPTKTFEYYAAGLPALLSELPDYRVIFDDRNALFCPFKSEEIAAGVEKALALGRDALDDMGQQGREAVYMKRDYARLANDLVEFLNRTMCDKI